MKAPLKIYILSTLTLFSCRSNAPQPASTPNEIAVSQLDKDELVRSAYVFQGIDGPFEKTELEVKNGPLPPEAKEGVDYFPWGQEVNCTFSDKNFDNPPGGLSPKFICDITDASGNVVSKNVKLKYDQANPEIYNEMAGSRLFWLLGFPSDYYYSVKIKCTGCPTLEDPWTLVKKYKNGSDATKASIRNSINDLRLKKAVRYLEPVVIEKKWAETVEVEGKEDTGWSFVDDLAIDKSRLAFAPEKVDEELAKRHALVMLAGMISHVDNQAGNQRVYCKKEGENGSCAPDNTWMIIHDLGASMGGFRLSWDTRTTATDKAQLSLAMNIWENKASTAVFTSDSSCEVSVASLSPKQTLGPLKTAKVSEAGRNFLLSRFVALGGGVGDTWTPAVEAGVRKQLNLIFLAGRNGELYKNTAWWVDTMMNKIKIIRNYTGCQQ